MEIKDFEVGSNLKVIGYDKSKKAYRQKLLSMGLVRGVEFKLVRVAPMGDPVELKIKSFNLSLRKDEAASLIVEEVSK